MRSENYRNYFKSSFMMGPNYLRLLDAYNENATDYLAAKKKKFKDIAKSNKSYHG